MALDGHLVSSFTWEELLHLGAIDVIDQFVISE